MATEREEDFNGARGNLAAAKASVRDLTEELSDLRHSYVSLSGSFAELEGALKAARTSVADKSNELADLYMRLSRERQRLAQAEDEAAAEVERADNLEAEVQRLRQECEGLALKHSIALKEIADLSATSVTLQATIDELGRLRGELQAERVKTSAANDRVEAMGQRVVNFEGTISVLELTLRRREQQFAIAQRQGSWRRSVGARLFRLLRGSRYNPLFDREWYLQQNPDVRKAKVTPYDHYCRYGAKEGRNPNPLFDSKWYLSQNPDVAEAGMNPLEHFYLHGAAEGRDPHPLFSIADHARWFPQKLTGGGRTLGRYWDGT